MPSEQNYSLQYPGATIDQLLSKVNGADGTPTANSENLVKSGGVKSYVDGKTGDLSQLQTTAKTSLVAAINEASQSGSENAVLYVLQNLTAEQKAQARANIDALSPAELDEMQIVTVTTLPTASASTMGNLYLVGPDANNNYLRYFTQKSGSSYSWVAAGSTVIDLSGYATKEEVNQLNLKGVVKSPGVNLFDKSTVKLGYLINASGNEEANASYNASDYIPVTAGESYCNASESAVPFRFVNFYDSNKAHTSSRLSDQNTFTVPNGASYVRVTFYVGTSYNNYAMVAQSATRIPYQPYTPIGGYEADIIKDGIVSTSKVQNKAITMAKLGDDVVEAINDASEGSLKNIEDYKSLNLANPADYHSGYWNTGVGASDSYRYVNIDISELEAGSTLTCMNSMNVARLMRFVQFYDGTTYKSGVADVNSTTIPSGVDNVYITFYVANMPDGKNENIGVFNSASPNWEKYAGYTKAKWAEKPEDEQALARLADINIKYIIDVPSANLMNPADVQVGYWNTGYVNNSSYRYFKLDLTKIAPGTTISALRSTGVSATMRFCQFYKGATLKDNQSSVTSATVPNDVDSVYISFEYPTQFPNSTISNCGVFNSASPEWTPYEIYTKALWTSKPSNTQALARIADLDTVIVSKLKGKKWCPLGDSFTEGVVNTTLDSGQYAGQHKVYPYFIGNRTGINVVSTFFASGRTLAFPATPGDFTNSICNPSAACYYQNIPADVDYITIYLGINDSHHAPGSGGGDGEDNTGEIPIGTITDNTTSTYYGAWNVVLSWLIENRPFAHIGIIVSNGCDTADYRTAQLAIARKYGIPFIDLNGDDNTPFMIRSMNGNIPSAIRSIRTQAQAVNYPDNTHPNDAAHEFESYFIESFLERI